LSPNSRSTRQDSTWDRIDMYHCTLLCRLWLLTRIWNYLQRCSQAHIHPWQLRYRRRTPPCPRVCRFRNSYHRCFRLVCALECMTCTRKVKYKYCTQAYTWYSYSKCSGSNQSDKSLVRSICKSSSLPRDNCLICKSCKSEYPCTLYN
jgi:hypothetical protein